MDRFEQNMAALETLRRNAEHMKMRLTFSHDRPPRSTTDRIDHARRACGGAPPVLPQRRLGT